ESLRPHHHALQWQSDGWITQKRKLVSALVSRRVQTTLCCAVFCRFCGPLLCEAGEQGSHTAIAPAECLQPRRQCRLTVDEKKARAERAKENRRENRGDETQGG
ncbi:hypothetical protein, partial [Sulfitobacter sp.]|uniref:hypothetical protein n=1 Tax=Sulfitobacter sp. TaxID=1903071 RepID=UPI0026332681